MVGGSGIEKKIRRHIKSAKSRGETLTVTLSVEAKRNLEELQLRLLDKDGKKPTDSEVVESLLKLALEKEKVPYPGG